MTTQVFADGSNTETRVHADGPTQVIWRVRLPGDRFYVLEWWIEPGNPRRLDPPTTLDDARALAMKHAGASV